MSPTPFTFVFRPDAGWGGTGISGVEVVSGSASVPVVGGRWLCMKAKHFVVGLVLCGILAGCSGSSAPDPAVPAAEDSKTLPVQVLTDARDVAGQLEQRQANMESMVP